MLKLLQERKMSLIELFGFSKTIFKQKFKALAIISLIFAIPLSIVNEFILGKYIGIADVLNASIVNGNMNTGALDQLWIYFLILLIVSLFFEPIGSVATAIIVKRTLYGELNSWKSALLKGFEKGPTIILAGIVITICVAAGSILIVMGLYLAIIWYFYFIAIALDDAPAVASLTQSAKLVKGRFWNTFGTIFIVGILIQIISYAILILLSFGGDNYIFDIIYYIILYMIQTFVTVLFTLIYLNRKFMLEGTNKDIFSDV